MKCECCGESDTEAGQLCEGCDCCQECCNCTESDCDCDACVERRTNLNPELGRAITLEQRQYLDAIARYESAQHLGGSFPRKWAAQIESIMLTPVNPDMWREVFMHASPNVFMLHNAGWRAGMIVNGIHVPWKPTKLVLMRGGW